MIQFYELNNTKNKWTSKVYEANTTHNIEFYARGT